MKTPKQSAVHNENANEIWPPILLCSLKPGPQPEARVSNRDYLESLVKYGCWIRAIAADENRARLAQDEATSLERFSAIVSFYQQIGMLVEDMLTSLIGWVVFASDNSTVLADLNERLTLSPGQKLSKATRRYHEAIVSEFQHPTKRVRVDPFAFIASLSALPKESIPVCLGIPWKWHPSVKMVPRSDWDDWHDIPNLVLAFLEMFNESAGLVSSCYNKLKHGPQLIVSSFSDCLNKRHGRPAGAESRFEYVRLLFRGAETQHNEDEHVAPFLLHDAFCVNQIFYQRVMLLVQHYWLLAGWLLHVRFTKQRPTLEDNRIKKIVAEGDKWVKELTSGTCKHRLPDFLRE